MTTIVAAATTEWSCYDEGDDD